MISALGDKQAFGEAAVRRIITIHGGGSNVLDFWHERCRHHKDAGLCLRLAKGCARSAHDMT